jgi:hypothetical protein
MTDAEIKSLAHRIAWRYKMSTDPAHSDTYKFNEATLVQFARAVETEERERLALLFDLPVWLNGEDEDYCRSAARLIRQSHLPGVWQPTKALRDMTEADFNEALGVGKASA